MKAEYIDHMGDDLTVVNSARVSFDKESEWLPSGSINDYEGVVWQVRDGKPVNLSERDQRLIHYLANHNHWTPFSHCVVTMRETVPIFVARQRFKHMIGFTYNEISRRYVDSEPEFYVPDVWRKRTDNKKQGSSDEPIDMLVHGPNNIHTMWLSEDYPDFIQNALDFYNIMIANGVCPEQARMILPQSMMTSYYVTGSLAAWARAYKLRSSPDSQVEIQMLASQWNDIIRPLFPVSWEALTNV